MWIIQNTYEKELFFGVAESTLLFIMVVILCSASLLETIVLSCHIIPASEQVDIMKQVMLYMS
jgi:hypothetical protein